MMVDSNSRRGQAPCGYSLRKESVMNGSKSAALVLVSVLALVSIVAGMPSATGVEAQDEITIGYVAWDDTAPYFVAMSEAIENAATDAGVEVTKVITSSSFSQEQAIEEMVAAGVSGILLVSADPTGIVPAVEAAREAGVVVIALDSPTEPWDATNALIATDSFQAGYLLGQYARAALGEKEGRIATLDVGVPVGILRHNGFVAGFLGEAIATPVTEQDVAAYVTDDAIVCSRETGGDEFSGRSAMDLCLGEHPDINVVFAINDPAALGAAEAIEEAVVDHEIIVVSVDGQRSALEAVRDGRITATAMQFPRAMAEMGVEAILTYAETGEAPAGFIDSGVTLITDNPVDGVPSEDSAHGLELAWD
jgi:fructose transport system substrate-binding protein